MLGTYLADTCILRNVTLLSEKSKVQNSALSYAIVTESKLALLAS